MCFVNKGKIIFKKKKKLSITNYASLSAMNSYFGFQTKNFPDSRIRITLHWAIHSKYLKYAVWRLSRSYHRLNCFHANVSRFKVQDSLLQLYQ